MLKNRHLQVKVVKDDESVIAEPQPVVTLEETANAVGKVAEKVIREAGKAALAFVVLDTARQVLVALATKK